MIDNFINIYKNYVEMKSRTQTTQYNNVQNMIREEQTS